MLARPSDEYSVGKQTFWKWNFVSFTLTLQSLLLNVNVKYCEGNVCVYIFVPLLLFWGLVLFRNSFEGIYWLSHNIHPFVTFPSHWEKLAKCCVVLVGVSRCFCSLGFCLIYFFCGSTFVILFKTFQYIENSLLWSRPISPIMFYFVSICGRFRQWQTHCECNSALW